MEAGMLQCDRGAPAASGSSPPLHAAAKLAYFFDYVLPVLSDHWLRHSIATTYLESMYGSQLDEENVGCGPVAFAALCGVSVADLPMYFPRSPDRAWTNRSQMEQAIENFGWSFIKVSSGWPKLGLCFIHWSGPWTERGYAHAILQRTHWIAVIEDYVFDVNWRGWLPKENWEDVVVPDLLQCQRNACGWMPMTSYELQINPARHAR
jgi:hypothetical protein